MSEFPKNFDFVVYGTGIVESILSAALSTTGYSVLHLDKNDYYGGYSGCLRLTELEKILEKWKNGPALENNDNIYVENENFVKFVSFEWNIQPNNETEITANGSSDSVANHWNQKSLRQSIRGFELELLPRLLFSESRTVDALIQSDVTRYLEFKFVSKFAAFSDNKIIQIPINRSDIVKTKVFSLRQKRQLTSFLEWCFTVGLTEDLVEKYSNRPLFELMRSERNIDEFTEKIIIECLALSPGNVETKEGISKIKRLLQSFNKFGPYPIMWPNYGCGEIPQAFCRMAAVFGAVYSLNTSIVSCNSQPSQNGEFSMTQDERNVPINYRKLKLTLSNESDVYTDKIISHKSYLNSKFLVNTDQMRWISRAILITNKSLIKETRENNDILMLPFHIDHAENPSLLLELPIDNVRNEHRIELFVVHLISFTDRALDSNEFLREYINKMFDKYEHSTDSLKPEILFQCYFTLPDFSNVSHEINLENNIGDYLIFVNSTLNSIELDECVKEAHDRFSNILPGVEFLPRPPNPEDIIQLEQEAVPSTNQISGDFPFATVTVPDNFDILNAPGDSPIPEPVAIDDMEGQTLSDFLVELELNAGTSETESANQ